MHGGQCRVSFVVSVDGHSDVQYLQPRYRIPPSLFDIVSSSCRDVVIRSSTAHAHHHIVHLPCLPYPLVLLLGVVMLEPSYGYSGHRLISMSGHPPSIPIDILGTSKHRFPMLYFLHDIRTIPVYVKAVAMSSILPKDPSLSDPSPTSSTCFVKSPFQCRRLPSKWSRRSLPSTLSRSCLLLSTCAWSYTILVKG